MALALWDHFGKKEREREGEREGGEGERERERERESMFLPLFMFSPFVFVVEGFQFLSCVEEFARLYKA